MPEHHPTSPARRALFALGLALALALLVGPRLALLRCEPFVPGAPLLFDEKDYIRAANAFAAGSNSSDLNEAWMRAPATSWLLLTVARLRGLPVELAACDFQRVQTALWAALLLAVAGVAAQLFGRRAALASALLVALLPVGLALTLLVHADTLFALGLAAAVGLLLQHARGGRLAWAAAAGAAAGLAALTRSPVLPLLPLLALWAAARGAGPALEPGRRRLGAAAARAAPPAVLLLLCAALVLTPWTLRNYRLYGGLIPSDTTGAVTLFDNNAPKRSVSYTAIRNSSDNPVERQRYAMRQAWAVISADPGRFARKFVSTSWLAWGPDSFPHNQGFYTALLESPRGGALLAQLGLLLWLALPLALLGLLLAPRDAPGARGYRLLMLAFALVYTLMMGATHFEERYRLPFLLLLLPYAGWCLAHPRALLARLRRPAGLAAAAALLALACSYAPQVWPQQWESARALALHGRGLLRAAWGDQIGAAADQREALALLPSLGEARLALAGALAAQGDRAGAEQTLRSALAQARADRLRPPPEAVLALQRLLPAGAQERRALDAALALPARRRAEELAWRAGDPPQSVLRMGQADLGLVRGFYAADADAGRTFRWSGAQAGVLLEGAGDTVCLLLNAARPPGLAAPTVALTARPEGGAETAIGQVRPPRAGWATLCAALPPGAADGPVEIGLRAPSFNPLAQGLSSDARDLGVAVAEVRLARGPLALDPSTGLLLTHEARPEQAASDLALVGATIGAPARPGALLPVSLWWRAEQAPPAGLFTFLHLLDAEGRQAATYNAPLAGGQRPQPWAAGEPLPDPTGLALPADLPPGRYRLVGGVFDPASGAQVLRADLGELAVELP